MDPAGGGRRPGDPADGGADRLTCPCRGAHAVSAFLLGCSVRARYDADVVIKRGQVRRRRKKPSKPYRDRFGHTPLSGDESIPWGGPRLIVGTGADGRLPIMAQVYEEAARRNVEVVALPTEAACRLIAELKPDEVNAVLHVTC